MSIPSATDSETCRRCGRPYYPIVWWADDELWQTVTAMMEFEYGAGLLCPFCFSVLAEEMGLPVKWAPRRVEDSSETIRDEWGNLIDDDYIDMTSDGENVICLRSVMYTLWERLSRT